MANIVMLNNVAHKDVRVIARHAPEFGDSMNLAAVFPTEFAELQREYPILFRKDVEGKYQAVVILGLDKDENLYLTPGGWQARYVPAVHQRGPFMIGFQEQEVDGELRREPMLYIDLDHPRVSDSEGQPLFMPQGGNSPYLQRVTQYLRLIHGGVELVEPMFAMFEEYDLIEPVELDVRLDEHTVYKVPGVFSISQEKLVALDGAALERMHKSGFLRLAYFVRESISNMSHLISMKNAKRAAQAQG